MKKFSIIEIVEKTASTGTIYHTCTLRTEDEVGEEIKASSFDLKDKKIGDIVEGEIVMKGQYKNFHIKKEQVARGGGASAGIKVAQERKQEMIEKTMDRKEDSFKITATFRDATILTQTWSTKAPFPTSQEIEEKWVYFRKWLWEHYDMDITDTKAF